MNKPNKQPEEGIVVDYGEDTLTTVCEKMVKILMEKREQYGFAFQTCPDFLSLLYPEGIPSTKYREAIFCMRMYDKMMRLANQTDKDIEDPMLDLLGYALLYLEDKEVRNDQFRL